jgi:hypothetical protein
MALTAAKKALPFLNGRWAINYHLAEFGKITGYIMADDWMDIKIFQPQQKIFFFFIQLSRRQITYCVMPPPNLRYLPEGLSYGRKILEEKPQNERNPRRVGTHLFYPRLIQPQNLTDRQ